MHNNTSSNKKSNAMKQASSFSLSLEHCRSRRACFGAAFPRQTTVAAPCIIFRRSASTMAPAAAAQASSGAAPPPTAAPASARPAAAVLAFAGPASALAAGLAVAKGLISIPTALLALALLGAAAVILRTLLEPSGGAAPMPSLQQALHLIQTRRSIFPRDFSGGFGCVSGSCWHVASG